MNKVETQILGERQGGDTVGGLCEGFWLAGEPGTVR